MPRKKSSTIKARKQVEQRQAIKGNAARLAYAKKQRKKMSK